MKIQFFIFLFLFSSCFNKTSKIVSANEIYKQQNKEFDKKKLDNTIFKVVKYYNSKDEKEFNKLIHPDIGLYILYRNGSYDFWEKIKLLHFKKEWNNDSKISYWLKDRMKNQIIKTDNVIHKYSNRVIECESIKAEGLFIVDDSDLKYILSNTIKQFIRTGEVEKKWDDELKSKLKEIKKWEDTNQRIVLTIKESGFYGNSFIFYLSKIENNWYITIIDFITTDCSS